MNVGKLLVFLLFSTILLSGCLGTRFLNSNESLLYKQKTIVNKGMEIDGIEELYTQSPNSQFPILPFSPYVWFYQVGVKKHNPKTLDLKKESIKANYDSLISRTTKHKKKEKLLQKRNRKTQKIERVLKEGNLFMRWGEPLAVYDSFQTKTTIEKIKQYLHAKGYFDVHILHKANRKRKLTRSIYKIEEGTPYLIDTVFQRINDSTITQLLKKRSSKIVRLSNYDQDILTEERSAITNFLKDNGYYNFSREYVSFDIDTAYKDHRIALQIVVKNPPFPNRHRQFSIDSINFIISKNDANANNSTAVMETYRGVVHTTHPLYYAPKILDRKIFLDIGGFYSQQKTLNTQRQLANLDIFKFININYDSTGGKFVANIFTQPFPRYQWTNEFGINVTQGFPGPFYSTTLKKRNVFRGLENLELSSRIGIEGTAATSKVDDVFTSIEAGINAALTFPQFVFPIKNSKRKQLSSLNPKTRLSVGYSLINRPEYNRKNTNFTTTYSWGRQLNTLYNFSLADVSIINSELTAAFKKRLNTLASNGSNLINSFKPSLVSSSSFFIIKNFNNYGSGKQTSSYLQIFTESGGVLQNLFSTSALEQEGLETYKFLKFNIDYRKVKQLSKSDGVAFRFNAGIAFSYGTTKTLPYEKYFFAGGSSGIRGWRPRRLGPGSYTPLNKEGEVSYQFEQNGEILLQTNIEFRRKLLGFVDWAYFIDAGNIWLLDEDKNRPGAQFQLNTFFREIAVTSGLGIRFNFVFLIIRLDSGLKMYDPARPRGKRFIFSNGFKDPPFDDSKTTEPIIFNIGIGYPF